MCGARLDPSGDDDGNGTAGTACRVGEVDLFYYCKNADGTPAVPENTCLAASSLDETTRLNLSWLDHQIVGIDAVAFTCTESAGVYTIQPASGVGGAWLNIEELNPTEVRVGPSDFDWYLPDFMETGQVSGVGEDVWYRGVQGTISVAFYNSQTPTVRALIDQIFDMAEIGGCWGSMRKRLCLGRICSRYIRVTMQM